jgi:hypothetical protein
MGSSATTEAAESVRRPGARVVSSPGGADRRSLDVLAMHRLSRSPDGSVAILRWLAHRTGCWVGLLDATGAVLVSGSPDLDRAAGALLARGVGAMFARGLRVFAAHDGPAREALLLELDQPEAGRRPVLGFVGDGHVPRALAGDAALVLGTCWWAEESTRARRRSEDVDVGAREAVLHLLMSRHIAPARQIAAALTPPLPDPVRVHVVECSSGERDELVRQCVRIAGHRAWIVRCPVHVRHVIVVAAEDVDLSGIDGGVIGTSDVVALLDTSAGYEQAIHALAVARGRSDRRARFDSDLDLAALIGPAGGPWATAVLAPLLSYVPVRGSGPDAEELTTTVRSWLSFSTAATRHLKIHRNTLAGRLRLVGELLGRDLGTLEQRAVVDLALRIRLASAAGDPVASGSVDDLLRAPAVRNWALSTLRPLRESANGAVHEATLRAWLGNGARMRVTADELGISVPGMRKRLYRMEQLLNRSLLQAPSARHDLWFALRVADVEAAPEPVRR